MAPSTDNPAALEKLAATYRDRKQYIPALKVYDRLIELGCATAEIWRATGDTLADVGEYAQATQAYENSLVHDSSNPETHHQLGRVLYRLGELDKAIRHLESATEHSDAIAPWLALATAIPGAPQADMAKILSVRTRFAEKLAEATSSDRSLRPPGGRLGPQGRLRVGYVSAFFHSANYMKPVWGLINNHDRSAFQVHLLSDSPPGEPWQGYRPHPADRVHAAGDLDNGELAELIRSEGIDILVDLNAYSEPDRLSLFLARPAPVTIAWFNMYATSGLPGFDYLVGDDEVVYPAEERFYTERIVRLPLSYLTFQVDHPTPPIVPPPCLKNGYLTFGSLVAQYKITRPVLDAWSDLLRRSAGSRLFLANTALKSIHNRRHVVEQFLQRGVAEERLEFAGPADHFTFLRYYDQIDVALDAFPYNGGTTTMEAIWQGVPVLTLEGDRWAGRTSQSLLRRTPLAEFVTGDERRMVDFAVRLAASSQTPSRLADLRHSLRAQLRASPVCDSPGLARALERCYRAVARRVENR